MRLGRQVVELIRLGFLNDADQVGRVGQVSVMQDEVAVINMRILIEVVDAARVEAGAAAFDAMNGVALLQQQLCKVGSILSGDAGNECFFLGSCVMLHVPVIGLLQPFPKRDARLPAQGVQSVGVQHLRGVPSGRDAPHVSVPEYPTVSAIASANSWMVQSVPQPILMISGES